MAITLGVVPSDINIAPVSNAARTNPQIGGVRQRKIRLGSHFRATGKFPPLTMDAGRIHAADILACEVTPVRLTIPQPELVVGTPGSVTINGAGQSGFSLIVDGATPGYTFKKGQLFNYILGSPNRYYLHSIQADVVANGSGQATLSIWPMLRISPLDNSFIEILAPKIEGWLEIDGGWVVTPDFTVETSFSVEEAA